jgi:O-antigen ligase
MLLNTLTKISLVVVFLYIVLGNIPRIVQLPGFRDNVLITEAIFYMMLILYAFLSRNALKITCKYYILFSVILISFIYGTMLNQFDFKSSLYVLRLVLFMFCSAAGGYLLYRHYKLNINGALHYLFVVYLYLIMFGFLIYFAFPQSYRLWEMLSQFGIVFNGDPHVRRFVSPYLDPNYFAAIACLPLLLSFYLYKSTKRLLYLLGLFLAIVSIMLSGSRSGMATMMAVIIFMNYRYILLMLTRLKTSKSYIYTTSIVSLIVILCSPLYIQNIIQVVNRIISIPNDPSALYRLYSFMYGFSIFSERPILGVGYNYLSVYMENYSDLSSVDSSILGTLINFGLVFSLIIFGFISYRAFAFIQRLKRDKRLEERICGFVYPFLMYVLFVILFTSQFNNVVYYQFWVVPVLMISTYLSLVTKGNKHENHIN